MHYSHHVFFLLLCWICHVTCWWMRPPGTDDPITTSWIQTAAHTFIATPRSKKVLQNTHWQKGTGGWYVSDDQNVCKKKRCRYWFLFWRKDLIALPFVPPRFVASPFPNHLMVTTLVLTRNQQPEWNHASNDRLTPHLALQHLPIGFTIPTSRGLGTAFPTMSRSRGDLMWQCGDWWAQPKLEPQAKIPTSLF